jgi:3-deoxy-D-manno-octulosonic-acid transferase
LKNFRFVQQVLREADALAEVHADPELETVLDRLLRDENERIELGRRGGEAIRKNAGAINRTLDLLDNMQ